MTPGTGPKESPLAHKAEQLLQLVSRSERLEALPRTGWLVCGIERPESVAAHSYIVTIISMWLADSLNELPIDRERVLRIALLHDLAESMLTDLPAPVKNFIGKDVIANAEHSAAQSLLSITMPDWLKYITEYHQQNTLEARLVKAADRIQMLAKACQYASQNRGNTTGFWQHEELFQDFDIPLLKAIFDRLRSHHHQKTWYESHFD